MDAPFPNLFPVTPSETHYTNVFIQKGIMQKKEPSFEGHPPKNYGSL